MKYIYWLFDITEVSSFSTDTFSTSLRKGKWEEDGEIPVSTAFLLLNTECPVSFAPQCIIKWKHSKTFWLIHAAGW